MDKLSEQDFYDKVASAKPGDVITTPGGIPMEVCRPRREGKLCSGCALAMSNSPSEKEFKSHTKFEHALRIQCLFVQCHAWERPDKTNIILIKSETT